MHTDSTYAKLKGTGLYFNRSNVYIAPEGDNVSALNVGLNGQRWSQLKLNADTLTISRAAVEFMRVTSSGNVEVKGGNVDLASNGALVLDNTNNNNQMYIRNGGSNAASMQFGHSTVGGNILMQLTSDGKLGIGTTSPSEKLEVDGDIFINGSAAGGRSLQLKRSGATNSWKLTQGHTDTNALEILEGGNTRFIIKPGGNVGIGTTSPGYKLQVDGGNVAITGGSSSTLFLNENTNQLYGDENGVVILQANDNIRLRTNSSERVRINSSGNVGIGTTSPAASALFEVASTTKGVLLPRMNTTQINAISSPAEGLTVYNTVLSTLCFFNGVSWQKVTSTAM